MVDPWSASEPILTNDLGIQMKRGRCLAPRLEGNIWPARAQALPLYAVEVSAFGLVAQPHGASLVTVRFVPQSRMRRSADISFPSSSRYRYCRHRQIATTCGRLQWLASGPHSRSSASV